MLLAILLAAGLVSDMRSMPPSMNSSCKFDAASNYSGELYIPDDTPPSNRGVGEFDTQAHFTMFDWDQLSTRVGFGLPIARGAEVWARRLGAGWYIDWTVQRRFPTQLPEHWQMVRLSRGCVTPSKDGIHWLATHYPGGVWIIGNEPDNIWQDNITPEEYAQVYHELYYLVKEVDPRASIAVAGVTQATPLRLAYLDRVLIAYEALYNKPMPVDWWTVHGFVLREERGTGGAEIPPGFNGVMNGALYEAVDTNSMEYFKDQIIAFRTWMAQRGYRDKPLALTEFGILLSPKFGFTPDVVANYLWDTFTWLGEANDDQIGYPADDNRLVQRWAWFSISDWLYPTSNLANLEADALTEIGQRFREYNLHPGE